MSAPDSLSSDECAGHMSGCHVRDGSGICPNCKQPVGPAEQPSKDPMLAELRMLKIMGVNYATRRIAGEAIERIDRLSTALQGIGSCSSCEMCRNIAKRALGITEQANGERNG